MNYLAYFVKYDNMITKIFQFYFRRIKGASADAGPHYQKLYGRVTSVCGNRRGQPKRSAMQEPHPGRNTLVIIFTSPSGKYDFIYFWKSHVVASFSYACGLLQT